MGLVSRIKNWLTPKNNDEYSNLLKWLGIDKDTPKDLLSETTYFTCIKLLSETIGKLPLKYRQDTENGIKKAKPNDVYTLLRTRPNPYMTPTTFWSTVEMNRCHYGNAYVFCRYIGGKIKDLWIMQSESTQVYIDDTGYFGKRDGILYIYTDAYTVSIPR